MTIDYIRLSPTGNITVLVKTPVPRQRHGEIAARLLAPDCVGGEQAGFIEPPTDPRAAARLQMMGGEFCGNAAMSLAAVLARKRGLAEGEALDLVLEVSGADAPVPCRIRREGDGWAGRVQMPLPLETGVIRLASDGGDFDAPLIRLPGIAHVILSVTWGLDEAQLRRRLPEWNRALGTDAQGALTWDETASSIDPLVYVPSAGTLVREHGCGTGTAAIGCMLAVAEGEAVSVPVRQPGGVIRVEADVQDDRVTRLAIAGHIALLSEGSVFL